MKAVKVYSTYIKYFPRLLELAKNCQTSELTQLLLTVFENTLLREKNIDSTLPCNAFLYVLLNDAHQFRHFFFTCFVLQICTQIKN